ncbi:RHS repeat-associated core domain-containing protein [Paludifilum halophilum]|uniref:Teneurin-like YD-shell domain-containing protein n=1 Tax=Paludifilum halophilum TaxID=1642702 RepID=A0A235B4N2_9BACL|nr:RHS repeat-associated core domain-containing protein [Paludifilum halophilum]OYD06919.1 hypothetical protein CHM34_13335 [Paludifilum halophilum]
MTKRTASPPAKTETAPPHGKTIRFHYDQDKNVTYETDENGDVVARYTYGPDNEPVSMTRGGKTYYYQLNGHGDVVALTDETGQEVATYKYDAFGNVIEETGDIENPYRYAGYRYDEETGFYYLQSRYYNPETGRFLTRDSFEGFEKEPLSQNKYTYVENNPVMGVDPDGYWPRWVKWIWRVGKRYVPWMEYAAWGYVIYRTITAARPVIGL